MAEAGAAAPKVYRNQSGEYSMIDSETGQHYWVKRENFHQSMSVGLVPETPSAWAARQIKKRYSDRPVQSFALGVASGATFGLSSVALKNIAPGVNFEQIQAQNPGAFTAGEIAGTVGSALVPGSAVGAVGKVATKAGAKVAAKAAGKIGEKKIGKVAAGQISARASGAVTTGAIEGAAFGAGQTLGVEALKDEYDEIWKKVGLGAVSGAAAGGAFGAVGSVALEPIRAAKRKWSSVRGVAQTRKQIDDVEREYARLIDSGVDEKDSVMVRIRTDLLDPLYRDHIKKKTALASSIASKSYVAAAVGAVSAPVAGAAIGGGFGVFGSGWVLKNIVSKEGRDLLKGAMKFKSTASTSMLQAKEASIRSQIIGKEARKHVKTYGRTKKGALKTDESIGFLFGEQAADVLAKIDSALVPQSDNLRRAATALSTVSRVGLTAASVKALKPDEVKEFAEDIQSIDEEAMGNMEVLGSMAGASPQAAQEAHQTALSGIRELQARSPFRKPQTPDELMQIDRMSKIQLQEYKDRISAHVDPGDTIVKAMKGRATQAGIEQLQASYPTLHSELVRMANDMLSWHDANDVKIDTQKKRFLTQMLTGKASSKYAFQFQQLQKKAKQNTVKQRNFRVDAANKAQSRAQQVSERI